MQYTEMKCLEEIILRGGRKNTEVSWVKKFPDYISILWEVKKKNKSSLSQILSPFLYLNFQDCVKGKEKLEPQFTTPEEKKTKLKADSCRNCLSFCS